MGFASCNTLGLTILSALSECASCNTLGLTILSKRSAGMRSAPASAPLRRLHPMCGWPSAALPTVGISSAAVTAVAPVDVVLQVHLCAACEPAGKRRPRAQCFGYMWLPVCLGARSASFPVAGATCASALVTLQL